MIVLAIRKSDGQMQFNPPAEAEIQAGDYLIVMGEAGEPAQAGADAGRGARVKILTAAQMREVDRRTAELGIPGHDPDGKCRAARGGVSGARVRAAREAAHRRGVRQGQQRRRRNGGGAAASIAHEAAMAARGAGGEIRTKMQGDALANYKMLQAVGCPVWFEITEEMRTATLVVDAVLGTGHHGPVKGKAAEMIAPSIEHFPLAEVVAVDVPSGLVSDSGELPGETVVRAKHTVTFTAPKPCQVLSPACELAGKLHVAPDRDSAGAVRKGPGDFSLAVRASGLCDAVPAARERFEQGHVWSRAGDRRRARQNRRGGDGGNGGAAGGRGAFDGASAESAISAIASYAPEIMTEPLPETEPDRSRCARWTICVGGDHREENVVAIGPGMGQHPETVQFIRSLVDESKTPMVVDADALNALAGQRSRFEGLRILTPHPGEMSRLTGKTIAEIQADRIGHARAFATEHGVYWCSKATARVIASPDGRAWINPTGSPAMATGGTGDVLTGMIAGLVAQFPRSIWSSIAGRGLPAWPGGRTGRRGAGREIFHRHRSVRVPARGDA